jgi:hypothetical protein
LTRCNFVLNSTKINCGGADGTVLLSPCLLDGDADQPLRSRRRSPLRRGRPQGQACRRRLGFPCRQPDGPGTGAARGGRHGPDREPGGAAVRRGPAPAGWVAPAAGIERSRLQQWLNFIATELHKAIYIPLFAPDAPDGAAEFARRQAPPRFARLAAHLDGREYLLDRFTVADAYLTTVLNWSGATRIDLGQWPAVDAYYRRMLKRPSVARAVAEEAALYAAEQARHAAA